MGQLIMRYGEFEIGDVPGLFKTMPYFSFLFVLLIMVAIGLPPFSLFFGYIGILMSNAIVLSSEFVGIILIWFFSCSYFFQMMQSVLFGVAREDILYKDLGFIEIVSLVIVVTLLIIPVNVVLYWLSFTVNSFLIFSGISL